MAGIMLVPFAKFTVRDKVLTSLTGEHELSDGDDGDRRALCVMMRRLSTPRAMHRLIGA